MQQVLTFYEENRKQTLELIRKEARHLCYKYGRVTADMIRNHLGEALPSFIDKRIIGCALRGSPDLIGTGEYTKSTVKTSHGRPIQVFKLRR